MTVQAPSSKSPRRRVWITVVAVIAVLALAGGAVVWNALRAGGPSGAATSLPDEKPEQTSAGFGGQELNWVKCGSGVECADAYAPLDWDDPAGEMITLHLVRHPAEGAKRLGTLFLNPGGPGASGSSYVADGYESIVSADLRRQYDIVGWDPRGVEQSSAVKCLDAEDMDEYLFGVPTADDYEVGSDAWIEASRVDARDFGNACKNTTGDLIGHVSTLDTVHDLDMLRSVVGDEKLNYLGFSYGTKIGADYADTFPEKVGRMTLDGAMDPTADIAEVVKAQTEGFEKSLRAYAADCVQREDCPLGPSVDDAMEQIGAQLADVDEHPLTGSDGRKLTSATMLTAIITPLYSKSNWGYLDQLFTDVANGGADVALALADSYYNRQDGKYLDNSTEAFSAINCLDYPSPRLDAAKMRKEAAELDRIAPTIGEYQGYGELSCADWPVKSEATSAPVTASGSAPILVVGTTGDPATPYQWAQSLADQLENGVLLTYKGEGHTAYGEDACVDRVVDDYLLQGLVPLPAELKCG